jgi:hypothetical protein
MREVVGNFNWKGFSSTAVALSQRSRVAVHPRSVKFLGIVESSSSDIEASTSFFSKDND